jgi:hypothetical protein
VVDNLWFFPSLSYNPRAQVSLIRVPVLNPNLNYLSISGLCSKDPDLQ